MLKIQAFRALRPAPDKVDEVASVPYDTINSDEARELAVGRPWSFLHVIRPEIDLAPDCDAHDASVYAKAAENFQRFQDSGVLVREAEPCLYLYRQKMGDHVQSGIVACCHVDAYDQNRILKHEKTRQDKEDDRTLHVKTLNANAGPIFLTYRDDQAIDAIVEQVEGQEPLYHVESPDGVTHTVWGIQDSAPLREAFELIPCAYIADGHHRSAAAARTARELGAANPNHTGQEEYNWFLSVLFPASQLKILPYNRCVHDLNGLTEAEFLVAVRSRFRVTEAVPALPAEVRHVSMYLAGAWYGLSWDAVDGSDPVAALDVSYLQDNLLAPLLGIDDPRTSKRIDFVGGIRGTDELERLVDSGRGAVAFSMSPVSVDQMMDIADADRIMPPKSTWFEPKLRSGLLVHTLD
ncbi:MAG: DUF1015 domain-containing protein [Verrucomicrobia bacterium]|nr:DUF1015 domain-containing protein [Verrucomicrobiota bacterium]